ncbi:hypothetical protein SAMN03159473_01620 [Pseudomonas sp. NFACC52]|nr:hypothetical protein SAMN03159481_02096 [Pseudomonas sp. NFACC56-3]SFK35758.1 hypothetical protein SAMN03159473_01620 [Pseudomonas sp. NFACC52]
MEEWPKYPSPPISPHNKARPSSKPSPTLPSPISDSSWGEVSKSDLAKTANLGPAISAFLDNKTLSAERQNEIHRLRGLYARVKYGKAATETLKEHVAIPTFRKDGVAQHENPEFLKIADKIKSLAESFHLNFRNIDNRVYEISLEGSGDEVVGIHAQADVVPVTPENWVFKMAPGSIRSRSPWWAIACMAGAPRTTRTASSWRSTP